MEIELPYLQGLDYTKVIGKKVKILNLPIAEVIAYDKHKGVVTIQTFKKILKENFEIKSN
jgi:hypothetical protein